MILQALTRYYEDLRAQGKIDAPGWAPAKISFALYLDENGELTQVVPTMEEVPKGKKTVLQPQSKPLPAPVKRASNIASNFLWDNSSYLLGIDVSTKRASLNAAASALPQRQGCTTRCWIASIRPMPAQYWHFSTLGNRNARQSIRRSSGSSTM